MNEIRNMRKSGETIAHLFSTNSKLRDRVILVKIEYYELCCKVVCNASVTLNILSWLWHLVKLIRLRIVSLNKG